MPEIWLLIVAFISAVILTEILRRYALKANLLDVPNQRSSHSSPTPRGGGLAIVAVFFLISVGLLLLGRLDVSSFFAILGGGLIVSGISYWDDHNHVSARWRFSAHVLAAVWVITWLGSFKPLNIGLGMFDLAWFGTIVTVLFIVWMLNLYNFMDGIDGLAGVQGGSVSAGLAIILWYQGEVNIALWLGVLGAATAGFLIWNWPPAKIFMGDVGSSFLGFVFAAFTLLTHNNGGGELLWVWLIMCGVFVVDASLTLLARVVGGQKWYEPHRTHAYQWASRCYASHKKVTIIILIINGFWLFPLAWYAAVVPDYGLALLVIAYLPLVVLAFKFNAGKAEWASSS